jgi:hypothetical protein
MESISPLIPLAAALMCTDCEGRWPADWLLNWKFTTCPNCGGELQPPLWVTEAVTARREEARDRA